MIQESGCGRLFHFQGCGTVSRKIGPTEFAGAGQERGGDAGAEQEGALLLEGGCRTTPEMVMNGDTNAHTTVNSRCSSPPYR
jgi:hypothetical protein